MPSRKIVARELASVLRQVSHPDRIRVVLKLQSGEQTVNQLADALAIPPTRLSQHLAVLRGVALLETEVRGQKRVYRLVRPGFALWLIDGIDFIAHRFAQANAVDVETAKRLWDRDATAAHGEPLIES